MWAYKPWWFPNVESGLKGIIQVEVVDLHILLGFVDNLLFFRRIASVVKRLTKDLESGVESSIISRVVGGLAQIHPFADA